MMVTASAILTLLTTVRAADSPPVFNVRAADSLPVFNVRTYGAVGDGIVDDTQAFQRCIDEATNSSTSIVRYHDHRLDDPTVVVSRAEVYIPRGHYLLSRTLVLPSYNRKVDAYFMPPDLRGEARAILRMNESATDQDIIFGSQVVRWKVSGLQFVGGRNQIHVGNNNTDKGQILVTDCSFDYASGAAIRLLEPSRELQPANVGKPAHRRGAPSHTLRNFGGSFSTHVSIRDSVFVECVQALVNWADWTTLDNVWITSSPSMPNDTAVIENHDRLWMSNVLGVPREVRGSSSRQRWVDNYLFRSGGGRVSMRAFRFGGEGNGLGGVFNFAPFACELVPSPYSHLDICARVPHNATALPKNTTILAGTAITITDSLIDTHQEIIQLVEIPAAISVRTNQVMAGAKVPGRQGAAPLITLANGTDLRAPVFSAMFEMAAASWGRHLPLLRYDLDSETNWNGGSTLGASGLPPEMLPFTTSPRIVVAEAPTRGVWAEGALVWAATPTMGLAGWLYTSAGKWEPFGFTSASSS
jgi:hypothetical protein